MINIYTFRLTSIPGSSLLMNNPDSMQQATEGLARKKIPSPADEAAAKVYRLPSGQLFLKALAVRSAVLGAGAGRRLGKVGATRVLAGAVFTTAVELPLVDPTTRKPITDYVVNVMRAVVQGNGVKRARPEIKAWSCDVDFEVDGDFIADTGVLVQLMNIAGRTRGVGDYRPEKMGPFGRFTAELVDNALVAAEKPTAVKKPKRKPAAAA